MVVGVLALIAIWFWTPDKDRAALEARYLAAPGDLIDRRAHRLDLRGGASAAAEVSLAAVRAFLHGA